MNSSDNKSHSTIKVILTLAALISTAGAQSCTASSHDCCWVVKIWRTMKPGATVVYNPSKPTECCFDRMPGLPGNITCTKNSKPKIIYWVAKGLTGPLPGDIGKLKSLERLYLQNNSITSLPTELGTLPKLAKIAVGFNNLTSIAPSIGQLPALQDLWLRDNPNLVGEFTIKGGSSVFAPNTQLILCGCGTKVSSPNIFPSSISADCIAKTNNCPSSLVKRAQVQSAAIPGFPVFKCNIDEEKSPFAECITAMVNMCKDARRCKALLPSLVNQMADVWKNVVNSCKDGQFGRKSISCTIATNALNGVSYKSDIGPQKLGAIFIKTLPWLWTRI